MDRNYETFRFAKALVESDDTNNLSNAGKHKKSIFVASGSRLCILSSLNGKFERSFFEFFAWNVGFDSDIYFAFMHGNVHGKYNRILRSRQNTFLFVLDKIDMKLKK